MDTAEDEMRRRLLEVLDEALEAWPRVTRILFDSEDDEAALAALRAEFGWDENSARAVMDVQARRATRRERRKLHEQLVALRESR